VEKQGENMRTETGRIVCTISPETLTEYKAFLTKKDSFSKKYGCDQPATMAGALENAVLLATGFEARKHVLWERMACECGIDSNQHLTLDVETGEIITH
jgi:microcompartment protein CcmK/EutM